MDLEDIDARNDCAGEDHEQFNRPTARQSRHTLKIWSRIPCDSEPKITVLARSSSNLAVSWNFQPN
jgi:hypothetical protein